MRCGMHSRVHYSPLSVNSEDSLVQHAYMSFKMLHYRHVLLDVSALCVQYAPPMVGEAAVFLLSQFNDTVNCAVVCRTHSHWVVDYCCLWLVAWDVEVHENEYYCSDSDTGCFSSLIHTHTRAHPLSAVLLAEIG